MKFSSFRFRIEWMVLFILILYAGCSYRLKQKISRPQQIVKKTFDYPLKITWRRSIYYSPARKFYYRDGLVFINNRSDRMFVLDGDNGAILAKRKITKGLDYGVCMDDWNIFYMDTYVKRGKIYKMNLIRRVGSVQKKSGYKGKLPVINFNRYLIVTHEVGRISFLDKETLKEEWSLNMGASIDLPPILRSDTLILVNGKGLLVKIDLSEQKVIRKKLFKEYFSLLSLSDSFLFLGTPEGKLYALSGDFDLLWEIRLRGRIKYAPVSYQGRFYLLTMADELAEISESGEILASFKIESPPGTNPILVDDYLLWGDLSHRLNIFSLEEKKVVWSKEFPGRLRTDPLWTGSYLYIGCEDKYVYALRPEEKDNP